jgi:hypothetical protein
MVMEDSRRGRLGENSVVRDWQNVLIEELDSAALMMLLPTVGGNVCFIPTQFVASDLTGDLLHEMFPRLNLRSARRGAVVRQTGPLGWIEQSHCITMGRPSSIRGSLGTLVKSVQQRHTGQRLTMTVDRPWPGYDPP